MPTMPTKKNATATKACSTCAHYNAASAKLGECRRHAPQTIAFQVDDGVKFESRFPQTKATDWCGDFAKA
jgi:hypothetical protein